ncbi:MAG TPA: hypothetical protein VMS63_05400 [Gaiellaceae bacterium]|nr:hypothetical protein [Gaiellaceae bacterium]
MRRVLAWLVALPLLLAGSQAAHLLAYRWVYPEAHVRLEALVSTGHGYLSHLPLVLGVGSAIASLSLLLSAVDAARGRPARALPAWAFALLPPLAFVLQEFLERSLHLGAFAWQTAFAPTFLPGLALQLPFALAAYVAARLLLRAVERAGRALAPVRPPVRRVPAAAAAVPVEALPVVGNALSRRLAKRGPPLPSLA